MSHLVIHKIDIGKVKTSKNVMKLLKLLLTVIVKHPVDYNHPNIISHTEARCLVYAKHVKTPFLATNQHRKE